MMVILLYTAKEGCFHRPKTLYVDFVIILNSGLTPFIGLWCELQGLSFFRCSSEKLVSLRLVSGRRESAYAFPRSLGLNVSIYLVLLVFSLKSPFVYNLEPLNRLN